MHLLISSRLGNAGIAPFFKVVSEPDAFAKSIKDVVSSGVNSDILQFLSSNLYSIPPRKASPAPVVSIALIS